jgi:hypothetical protein
MNANYVRMKKEPPEKNKVETLETLQGQEEFVVLSAAMRNIL